jgi:hypothetical protein
MVTLMTAGLEFHSERCIDVTARARFARLPG